MTMSVYAENTHVESYVNVDQAEKVLSKNKMPFDSIDQWNLSKALNDTNADQITRIATRGISTFLLFFDILLILISTFLVLFCFQKRIDIVDDDQGDFWRLSINACMNVSIQILRNAVFVYVSGVGLYSYDYKPVGVLSKHLALNMLLTASFIFIVRIALEAQR